jgi:hypothetical protein
MSELALRLQQPLFEGAHSLWCIDDLVAEMGDLLFEDDDLRAKDVDGLVRVCCHRVTSVF